MLCAVCCVLCAKGCRWNRWWGAAVWAAVSRRSQAESILLSPMADPLSHYYCIRRMPRRLPLSGGLGLSLLDGGAHANKSSLWIWPQRVKPLLLRPSRACTHKPRLPRATQHHPPPLHPNLFIMSFWFSASLGLARPARTLWLERRRRKPRWKPRRAASSYTYVYRTLYICPAGSHGLCYSPVAACTEYTRKRQHASEQFDNGVLF